MNFKLEIGEKYFYGRRRLAVIEIFDEEMTVIELTASGRSISIPKKVTRCRLSNNVIVNTTLLKQIPSTGAYDLSVYNNDDFEKALERLGTPKFVSLVRHSVYYKKAEYGRYFILQWLGLDSLYVLRNKYGQTILASPIDILRIREGDNLEPEPIDHDRH